MFPIHWLQNLVARIRKRAVAVVTFDENAVHCRWPDGTDVSAEWTEVDSIEMWTTDAGPFIEDVFLVLRTAGGNCVIPQEAAGFSKILDHVEQFPGFNADGVLAAMSCTDNAIFPCWTRPNA